MGITERNLTKEETRDLLITHGIDYCPNCKKRFVRAFRCPDCGGSYVGDVYLIGKCPDRVPWIGNFE